MNTNDNPPDVLECLDDRDDGECGGVVSYRAVPGGTAWPRCVEHFEQRLAYENSLERYADSDVPPSWFDPSLAGESWDDE
jgi:hypothetical protein